MNGGYSSNMLIGSQILCGNDSWAYVWPLVLQAANEALQQLVLEVAQNKQDAQRKVASLLAKYEDLLAKV